MNRKGSLIILSGPSGTGKGTLVDELVNNNNYSLSISATTRKPRHYEKDGVHYFFYSKDKFEAMKNGGELLEWAQFCGNCYGTPRQYVEEQLLLGKNILLEIEVIGARQVKEIYPESILIFILPPNLAELRRRLTGRGTEDHDVIEKRLHRALEEIRMLPYYDYAVVNRSVKAAAQDINTIVKAETMSCKRNHNLIRIFEGVDELC